MITDAKLKEYFEQFKTVLIRGSNVRDAISVLRKIVPDKKFLCMTEYTKRIVPPDWQCLSSGPDTIMLLSGDTSDIKGKYSSTVPIWYVQEILKGQHVDIAVTSYFDMTIDFINGKIGGILRRGIK